MLTGRAKKRTQMRTRMPNDMVMTRRKRSAMKMVVARRESTKKSTVKRGMEWLGATVGTMMSMIMLGQGTDLLKVEGRRKMV